MSWASRRQTQYISGLLVVLGLIGLAIAWPTITRAPTCSDGKQNGDERGVDCGGVCQRICMADASEPITLWSRAFPVTGSVYNLMAYVENRNKAAAIEYISYDFKMYDMNNILLGHRVGTTYIPPNQQFAIFEPRFDAGQSQIKTVVFEFTSPFIWIKKPAKIQTLPIMVDNVIVGADPANPSLSARVNNDSIYDLPQFDVIAILYDRDHNVINVSKTHKDGLLSNTNAPVIFTWPNPLGSTPVTNDVLVQINPFTTSF